jgi:integrase
VGAGIHTAPSKSITVAEAAKDWVESVKLEGREATTIAQNCQHAQHINVRIGNTKLANLTTLTAADGEAKYTGLHSLRHFFASWLINPPERGGQGLAPKVVQQRLGHSSILMTTDTYAHLFPPEKVAHEKLADAEHALLADAT